MKEQFLLYGVCAAISVAAVAVTSFLKIVICAIAKRCGRNLSGNVKEYLFTPIALLLAAGGEYIWLEIFRHIEDEQLFILLISCFSLATMLIYWLLFQPTRKAAVNLIRIIAKKVQLAPIVEAVEQSGIPEILTGEDSALHSNAESGISKADNKKPIDSPQDSEQTETAAEASPLTAEDQLWEMVNALKQN